jgi:hypothetical protein
MLRNLRLCPALVPLLAFTAVLPAAEPAPTATEIRGAVTKALPLLQKGAAGHMEQRTCVACHNQGIPLLAVTTARARGFDIDEVEVAKNLKFIAAFLDKNRANYLKGRGTGGQVDTAGYALLSLEVGRWKPDDTTAAVTEYMLLYQKESDHWRTPANRPPTEFSSFTTSYLALRALQSYGTAEQKERIAARREQVRGWVQKAAAKDTEDRVFRLRALHAAGTPAKDVQAAAEALLQTQHADGGWGQLDDMASDAYATATVLTALHQAGGLTTDDAVYRRGLRFLLQTQREDGSWYVKSRSKPFQAYYESGFPHGRDQFISMAASGWATTALALACPPKSE